MTKITAARGGALRCKGWRQEAILRMLENNLENGERPEDLVIYTGARAARDWDAYEVIVRTLKDLDDDETMLVQSGKPIARMKTHARAPRVLMANGNVLGRWAGEEEYWKLERKGLTYMPGMTAAAWQYIGAQGILQGTYQSFMGAAERFFGGTLAGRTILTAGCGGMGGAQPLAGKMAGAATLVVDVDPTRIQRRVDTGYCDRMTADLDEALAWIEAARAAGEGLSVGLVANVAPAYEALLERGFQPDILTDQTMTDPRRGYVPDGMTAEEARKMRETDPDELGRRGDETQRRHVAAFLKFREQGAVTFEYGNGLRLRSADRGVTEMLEVESFVTMFIRPLFCEGFGPFRWIAISGDPGDIAVVDDLIGETFSDNHPIHAWIALAREHVQFTGLPARIGWLGHGERSRLALKVNEAVADGRLKGPIAFTRDHLDSGSVANPFRESEKMADGSEAVSDWPILNALLACANGADLVAVHSHGDRSQSAGQTCVADGSDLAAAKLGAVLDGDTGIGVVRHAEAGYESAIRARGRAGLDL
ncbi:urocanate hydratase [Pikeienuella piscinae]|uniref:Urocanate hydratase n=1 Tax=Pikeienuella piscinae TaxID=2748098 RepID=A0A7M3T689_9RHOB|nr:urocanate hydratase [Pikeienuella piscinae]QIE57520.1 urocanate hydratase [Pikeienuella piscinae]